MRKITEPPPAMQCGKCGGQLRLKHVDTANAALGLNSNVFACTTCGVERAFVAHRDHYSSGAIAPQRLFAAPELKRPVAALIT